MQRTSPPRYRPPLKPPQSATRTEGSFVGRCPHMGTAADPGTALAFASDANQCYRTRLPVPISMVHQENYCLSPEYVQCPVYQQNLQFAEVVPLVTAPPPWMADEGEIVTSVVIGPSRQQGGRSPVLPLILLIALLAGGFWLWRGFLAPPDNAEQALPDLAIGETTPIPETLPEDTGDAQPGVAIAIVNPTETPAPSNTPVAQAIDSLPGTGISLPTLPTASATTPSDNVVLAADCASPEWWVPYMVQAADTMLSLAQLRGLTVDDVLLGNCLVDSEVTAGQVILLPPLAVVISISPTAVTPTSTRNSTASAAGPTATSTPRPTGTTPATATSSPVSFPTDEPDNPPGGFPTSTPVNPTATPVTPVRATQTATVPAIGPSATPVTPVTPAPPRLTVTPPSVIPTSTPPPTPTAVRPTQTPPPAQP